MALSIPCSQFSPDSADKSDYTSHYTLNFEHGTDEIGTRNNFIRAWAIKWLSIKMVRARVLSVLFQKLSAA